MPIRFFSLLAIAAVLTAPVAAVAQTAASPMPAMSAAPMAGSYHHHRRPALMRALDSLDLTPTQKQQIATFRSQQRQANQNADASTKRANAQKMRSQIMGILTPDQQTQLHAEMRHARGHAPAASGTPAAPMPAPTP